MPPKKRTEQTKRTPSISPTTSTSHTSTDHPHRLRRTAALGPSKPPPAPARREPTPVGAPPLEEASHKKQLTGFFPGTRTPFTTLLYVLLFLVLLLLGWYIYGMVTLLEKLKADVGWWGIITGDSGRLNVCERCGLDRSGRDAGRVEAVKDGDVEGSLNALADALGISPIQVASAVKPLIPQASLTSIMSKLGEAGSSASVRILLEDSTRDDRADATRKESTEKPGREGSVI